MRSVANISLNETMTELLSELREECNKTLKLLSQLEVEDLKPEQVTNILAELGAAVVHLNAHTDGLQELINDEIERL